MQSIRQNTLYNIDGNALIGFLIFLPILLSGVASLSVSTLYLKEKTKTLSICRQYLLQIQNQMSKSLEHLQKLNPLARRLRLQKRRLQYLLSVSPPVARPALLIRLSYVKGRQMKLAFTQKLLIKKAEAYAAKHLRLLKTKFYGSTKTLIFSSQVPSFAKLAVVATPLTSISPSYETSWNFTKKQSIQVTWTERPLYIMPSFLKFFLKDIPSVNGQCTSTLRKSTSKIGGLSNVNPSHFIRGEQGQAKWQAILL